MLNEQNQLILTLTLLYLHLEIQSNLLHLIWLKMQGCPVALFI